MKASKRKLAISRGREPNELYHVPFLPSEWNTVKNAFENRNGPNCFEALQVVAAWRLRSSSALPFTVQASEILIQAVLNDPVMLGDAGQHNFLESENVRLIYGMAITRFVNYVAERERQARRGMSIGDICKMHGIPMWVVDVRHAATHGHLPSLNALREAIDFCWGWLRMRYWNHGLLRESDANEHAAPKRPRLSLTRRKMPSFEASTSAASGCWPLADEDVTWADLPIGLGPGQRLQELDFRFKPNGGDVVMDYPNDEGSGDGAVQSEGGVPEPQESIPDATKPSATEEWNDDRRLELVQSLISFLGE